MTFYQNRNKNVAYFYNDSIGNFNYGQEHPMKPKRIMMTHNLINTLGIYKHLDVYRPHYASPGEMKSFHDSDYVDYLQMSSKCQNSYYDKVPISIQERLESDTVQRQIFKIGETTDCPTFDGLFDFCQISAGASIDSALLIAERKADIAINWAGGLHHAKQQEASGFCYINDIVICILTLLRYYQRVLYIDIDVHHGDGVEEAFFCTNRVMTVSFHQYGDDFFPGSGKIESIGEDEGKFYSINVPLKQGMNDQQYIPMFKNLISKIISSFDPSVIVLQCGADSLANDKLGHFNLSSKGHGQCIEFVISQNIPVIVLGGGGYTIENVARCWAYETAITVNKHQDLGDQIPQNEKYLESYRPDYKLHIQPKNQENKNTPEDIHDIMVKIEQYLRQLNYAPSYFGAQIEEANYFYINKEIDFIDLSDEQFDQKTVLDKDIFDSSVVKRYQDQQQKADKQDYL